MIGDVIFGMFYSAADAAARKLGRCVKQRRQSAAPAPARELKNPSAADLGSVGDADGRPQLAGMDQAHEGLADLAGPGDALDLDR
jgi:hypothetical protein